MPTYEYQCSDCGHSFEQSQSITAPPLTTCPSCGGAVRRMISGGTGFILKGAESARPRTNSGACSLETTGRTCCGRDARCGSSKCGE